MPSLLLLAACAPQSGVTPTEMATPNPVTMVFTGGAEAPKNMERAATGIKDNLYRTGDRLKKWALTPPPEEGPKKAVPASYCYQSLQDILCYRQPMPGWEARLVGYQGTDVESPSPATMKPLPVRAANAAMLPANRAANAKPLLVKAAIVPKADGEPKAEEMKEISVDAAHESLPDPALAPQL
ncbi:MAG: hypothetical protein EBR02_03255 [Alphaproteobacteria bacterium]|nr:hypothetical protein [Alphaproteobacteria bacterium]